MFRVQTRAVFLAAVLLFIMSPPSFIGQKDTRNEAYYWANTQLDRSSLKYIFNDSVCYSDENHFLGCMNAIKNLFSLANDREIELQPRVSLLSKGVGEVESFGIKEVRHKEYGFVEALLSDYQVETTEMYTKWRRAFKVTQEKKINFFELANSLVKDYNGILIEAELVAHAINSFLNIARSPHDHIAPINLVVDRSEENSEEYFGIGVILRPLKDHLIVVRTIPGGPAEKAGLRPGDLITKVQDLAVKNMKYSEANEAITGITDTEITLTFNRGKMKNQKIKVAKDNVLIDNVRSRKVSANDRSWGFIRINSFQKSDTCGHVEEQIYNLEADKEVSGFILDLRDNPGGLVEQALCVADLFLPRDYFMLEIRSTDGTAESKFFKTQFDMASELPVVVLINSGSASSAEIVAGVLRDHNRAALLGERTFGKGTILKGNTFLKPKFPNIVYYETYAQFYFPSGHSNHIVGLAPDFEINLGKGRGIPFREKDLFFHTHLMKDIPTDLTTSVEPLPTNYRSCLLKNDLSGLQANRDIHQDVALNFLSCITASRQSL